MLLVGCGGSVEGLALRMGMGVWWWWRQGVVVSGAGTVRLHSCLTVHVNAQASCPCLSHRRWAASKRSNRQPVTCVYCRANWQEGGGAAGGGAAAAGGGTPGA